MERTTVTEPAPEPGTMEPVIEITVTMEPVIEITVANLIIGLKSANLDSELTRHVVTFLEQRKFYGDDNAIIQGIECILKCHSWDFRGETGLGHGFSKTPKRQSLIRAIEIFMN